MPDDQLFFNGINGASGDYLLPPMSPATLSAAVRGVNPEDRSYQTELEWLAQKLRSGEHLGVVEGVDPKDITQSGWGIIFAHDADPAIREALQELIDFRKSQASQNDERFFKEYRGLSGYRPGETKLKFIERHGFGPGPVDPTKMPYYLLIVGDPETIPYRFQVQLDVQFAVGRIHFDRPDDYAQYAHSVVEAEKQRLTLPKQATFFAVNNPGDRATQLSASDLATPLANYLIQGQPSWRVDTIFGDQAVKSRLADTLGGAATPALLFTASHGMGFPNGDPRQLPHQGALLCQDWPGPEAWRGKPIPESFYFSGDDLASDANLWGLLAFCFACYGAGTPKLDEFAQTGFPQASKARAEIAPYAFLSRLPQRMLAHPKGGALAVIGHVERAWGYSFTWGRAGRQLSVFESALTRLAEGHPVGSALEFFNERYAELSSDLSYELEEIKHGKQANDLELAGMWTANNDARNYVVLGDPAVKLAVRNEAMDADQPIASEAASQPRFTTNRVIVDLPHKAAAAAQPQEEVATAAPPTEGGAQAQAGVDDGGTDPYGLIDDAKKAITKAISPVAGGAKQAASSASDTFKQFFEKLGSALSEALKDAAELEVRTYVSDRLAEVKYENGRFVNAAGDEHLRLRALTHIKLDGDTLICVPEEDGEVDTVLWQIHLDMVRQAQQSRSELLKTAISAASGLVNLIS